METKDIMFDLLEIISIALIVFIIVMVISILLVTLSVWLYSRLLGGGVC